MKQTDKTDLICSIVVSVFFAAFIALGIWAFCHTPRYTTIPETQEECRPIENMVTSNLIVLK